MSRLEVLTEISASRAELRTIAKQAGAGESCSTNMEASVAFGLLRALALNVEGVLARVEEAEWEEEHDGSA